MHYQHIVGSKQTCRSSDKRRQARGGGPGDEKAAQKNLHKAREVTAKWMRYIRFSIYIIWKRTRDMRGSSPSKEMYVGGDLWRLPRPSRVRGLFAVQLLTFELGHAMSGMRADQVLRQLSDL